MPDDEKPKPVVQTIPRTIPPRLTLTRVALYCRVSTQMERRLNSLSAQMDFQREDILDHPLWEYIDTYTDIGSGRSINSRPGFRRLMVDCEAGEIDLIFTKSISRLGRNCIDFLIELRRLKELGVDVHFQNEGIFLSDESSELILSLHAALPRLCARTREPTYDGASKKAQAIQNPLPSPGHASDIIAMRTRSL